MDIRAAYSPSMTNNFDAIVGYKVHLKSLRFVVVTYKCSPKMHFRCFLYFPNRYFIYERITWRIARDGRCAYETITVAEGSRAFSMLDIAVSVFYILYIVTLIKIGEIGKIGLECLHLNDWVISVLNVISFSDAVYLMCNIFIWNWSNTMNV